MSIIYAILIYLTLAFNAAASPRDCPGDMVLWQAPQSNSSECVCPKGRIMDMDITKPLAKFGKCTETFNSTFPKDIKKPLNLWLDASDPYGTGYRPSNGTIIKNWYDKSGNNLIFTGTATYMGILQFDNNNGFSGTTSPLNFTDPNVTVFIVEKNQKGTSNSKILTTAQSATSNNILPISERFTISFAESGDKITWQLGANDYKLTPRVVQAGYDFSKPNKTTILTNVSPSGQVIKYKYYSGDLLISDQITKLQWDAYDSETAWPLLHNIGQGPDASVDLTVPLSDKQFNQIMSIIDVKPLGALLNTAYSEDQYLNMFTFIANTNYKPGSSCLAIYKQGSLEDSNLLCDYQPNFKNNPHNKLLIAKDYTGYIMEVIIYTGSLPYNDRRKVEQYLAEKWGGSSYYAIK